MMTQRSVQTVTAYFDSSALVKRYMAETGTAWVCDYCDGPTHTVAIAEIGLVEIAAAFAGKQRGGFIAPEDYGSVCADLQIDARDEYALVAINRSVVDDAITLTGQHRLRGYDAVHLACAIRLNNALLVHHLPPLVLISADDDLLSAARALGLATDNPNDHP